MTAGKGTINRRDEALSLCEELLSDVELERIDPVAIARKAGRLARLLDDTEAMRWFAYETTGYPPGQLDPDAWSAAKRASRLNQAGLAETTSLGELRAQIDAAMAELSGGSGGTSDSEFAVIVERNKAEHLETLRSLVSTRRALLDKVVGAVHQHVAGRYQELRFGSAVETAFQVVRAEVDGAIADLVPDALPMISAAFENASSDNPEHWQAAASTCRRLLMAAADTLRRPGSDVDGRKMGQGNYVNRLVDWIVNQGTSATAAKMISADLMYLGPRLDAADAAGQKGAHVGDTPVTRLEASRYVTGTYLALGDILGLRSAPESDVDLSQASS